MIPTKRQIFTDLCLEPETLGLMPPTVAYELVTRALREYPQGGRAYLYAVNLMDVEGALIFGEKFPGSGEDPDVRRVAIRRLQMAIHQANADA